LQHPQEPDKELGTARLTHLCLKNSTLQVGLSWPNLKSALYGKNENTSTPFDPKKWGVLYLGTGQMIPKDFPKSDVDQELFFVSPKGIVLPSQPLDGIVLLDGTWSQAKALWWRNAWLLKLKRLVIEPKQKSLYGKIRKEPKKQCLSTIESATIALKDLEKNTDYIKILFSTFEKLLEKIKKNPVKR